MSAVDLAKDFSPGEVIIAFATAGVVLIASGVALHVSGLDKIAMAPSIDKGMATPVKVIPVLDLDAPLLKLGGKKKYVLPDRWVRQAPKPRVEQRAVVSTKASKSAKDAPAKDVKVLEADAGVPPKDAEIAKHVDTPILEVVDAGAPSSTDVEGHQDGVKEGTEADPLKARAVDIYRDRIAHWLSARFAVHGSGIPKEELLKLRAGAVVQLNEDRTVGGYTFTSSGNPTYDAAARATLDGVKGQAVPSPPENYPDIIHHQVTVTFVCREHGCD